MANNKNKNKVSKKFLIALATAITLVSLASCGVGDYMHLTTLAEAAKIIAITGAATVFGLFASGSDRIQHETPEGFTNIDIHITGEDTESLRKIVSKLVEKQ